jgi:6,7-dimethyl-8-ribityllumazine synthase
MSTAHRQIASDYDPDKVPDARQMSFGIVVSEWNTHITDKLLEGVYNTLLEHGADPDRIFIRYVPGSFELTYGARMLAEQVAVQAVIVLGCVVRGDTPHFDYVCSSVTQGITQLNIVMDIPFIFGVLTTDTMQQAEDRAGGKYGNKGDELAITAIKMIDYTCRY